MCRNGHLTNLSWKIRWLFVDIYSMHLSAKKGDKVHSSSKQIVTRCRTTKMHKTVQYTTSLHTITGICVLGIRMRIFASRQCTDYARASYAGAGKVCVARVTFAVGEASCLVFVVSKPRWPHCTVIPNLHLHHQRTLSSAIYLSRAYLNVSDCVMHIWPIRS